MSSSFSRRLFVAMLVCGSSILAASQSLAGPFGATLAASGLANVADLAFADDAYLAPLDAQGRRIHVVLLEEPALAAYTGGIAGLVATSPRTTGASRLNVDSPASRAYLAHLESRQAEVLSRASALLARSLTPSFQYLNVLNGMAISLSPVEAARLEVLPGVRAVMPDRIREIETDIGPIHIGAPSIWQGLTVGEGDTRGEGVVIGVLDTGINSGHPAFAATDGLGYTHTNPNGAGVHLGWCASNPGFCNDKLIGAWGFNPVGGNPEDTNGHGSHTASTAGGNVHEAAYDFGGTVFDVEISGVAPRANIIAYKVCNPSCPQSASVAAINQAVADGVDVLNYSISGSDNPWNDLTDLAFLDAFNAGMFVSASAGNSGPGASTVAKTGPWNAAVGASTHQRVFANLLSLDGGPQNQPAVQGEGPALASTYTGSLRWAGDVNPANIEGCSAFAAGSFTGQAALISRGGCTFTVKVGNAIAAGADLVVVYNNFGGPPISMGGLAATSAPSVMVDNQVGAALIAALAGGVGTVSVLSDTDLFLDPAYEDILGGFSSRGPSQFDVMAPTYVAPGVNILAAGPASGGSSNQWFQSQGTSMSSPHGAGAAALLLGLHPSWNPAEVRSALAMSANPGILRKENGSTPADSFDQGSGLLDLDAAGRVTLVMSENGANFSAANPGIGGDPRTLNVPHMVDRNCLGSCSWTRTVRNVSDETRSYNTSALGPTGMAISVAPSSFTLTPGQSQSLTIEVDVDVNVLTAGSWAFAQVQIVPQNNNVFEFFEIGEAYDFSGTWTAKTHDISALAGQQACLAFRLEGSDSHAWYVDDIQVSSGSGTHLDESFSGVAFPPAGWSYYQLGSNPGQQWVRTESTSNSAPASAFYNWNNPVNHDDGWLVSPSITLGANPQLSYFDRMTFPSFYRYSGVWASTGNCDPTADLPAATARLPVAVVPFGSDPEIDVSPASLTATQPPAQVTTQMLTIANLGPVELNWTIDEAPLSSVMLELASPRNLPPFKANLDPRLATAGPAAAEVARQITRFQAPAGSGSGYELALDDGVGENAVGLTGGAQFVWFNRFTPSALDFPITLDQVQVMFGRPGSTGAINVGELVDIYLYQDADGNPANGATHVASLTGQSVQAVNGTDWSTYVLTEPVTFDGPGDILVAVVNRTAGVTPASFPATIDESPPSQQRSWIGFGAVPADPPVFPLPTFGTIDSLGLPGNWQVRAQGSSEGACVDPAGVSWLSVDPSAGATAASSNTPVEVTLSSVGLAEGTYEAVLCINSNDPNNPLIGVPVSLTVEAAPAISVDLAQVGMVAVGDAQDEVTVTLTNVGTANLVWDIETEAVPLGRSYGYGLRSTVTLPVGHDRASTGSGTQGEPQLLFDNGPFITGIGDGPGGADSSLLQNVSLGTITLGAGVQFVSPGPHNRVAEDFTVTGFADWQIDTVRFFGYQTGSSTTSSFTGVNFRIWDGVPGGATSSVVFGDIDTNRFLSTGWTGAYRYAENNVGTTRPIMYIDAEAGLSLPPGNYWIDWQLAGTIASGPWQPPITIIGQNVTGNALQQLSTGWAPWTDTGTGTPAQGAPFQLFGSAPIPCQSYSSVPWLTISPTSGVTAPGESDQLLVSANTSGLAVPSQHAAYICIESNDPVNPVWSLPVWLNVVSDGVFQDRFE